MSRHSLPVFLRIAIQSCFAGLFMLSMLITGDQWSTLSSAMASVQFVPLFLSILALPSLLAVSFFLSIAVCTVLFGRFYCAAICPLGAMMDFSSFLNRRKIFSFKTPRRILQLSIFLAVVLTAAAGFPLLLDITEPYGIFARGIRVIFRPLYAALIAFWNWIASFSGLYGPDPVSLEINMVLIAASALSFLSVALVSFFFGRLFCRTLCPSGTVFEYLAKRPVFGIRIEDECLACRSCANVCPASCIEIEKKEVDSGRCVLCLSCLSVCPNKSIRYGFTMKKKSVSISVTENKIVNRIITRRDFFALSVTGLLSFILPSALKKTIFFGGTREAVTLSGITRTLSIAPGAVDLARFQRFCTGCGLCVSRCPTGVIRFLNPVQGLYPFLDFSRGYCTYDCIVCSRVCPTGALLPLSASSKHTVSVGTSIFERSRCIVITKGTSCGACAEHCPTGAVTMHALEKGKPTEPVLETDLCVGCGACEKICPAVPLKAIWVSGLTQHRTAKLPSGGSTGTATGDFSF